MERIDTAMILRRTGEMLRLTPVTALIAWLGMALPMTMLSTAPGGGNFAFVGSIISTFAQFIVTSRAARRAGVMRAEGVPGRAASYVLLGIVSGLAIAIGFVLLVLPGLYLLARWSIAVPHVIVRGATMREAMRRSWQQTRDIVPPTCAALVLVGSGLIVSLILDGIPATASGPAPLMPSLVSNLAAFASMLLTWFLALAIYTLVTREEPQELEEVFA